MGLEAWAEYRRTGYPELAPVIDNLSSGVVDSNRGMRRLAYLLGEGPEHDELPERRDDDRRHRHPGRGSVLDQEKLTVKPRPKIDYELERNSWTLLVAGLFVAGFTNCSDWTETENEWVLESQNTETNKPESYYQNLRAWKASDHAISFGWYSGWGEPTVSTTNMLAGIPDSMDIVSLWGNWSNLSEGKIKDLREVQQKKGTKVIFCSFTSMWARTSPRGVRHRRCVPQRVLGLEGR